MSEEDFTILFIVVVFVWASALAITQIPEPERQNDWNVVDCKSVYIPTSGDFYAISVNDIALEKPTKL